MVGVNKTAAFDSIPEALVTSAFTVLAALFSLCLVSHTVYKLYIEDVTPETAAVSPRSKSNSQSTRSSFTKKTAHQIRNNNKHVDNAVASLTVLYLLSCVAYTCSQSVNRVVTVFFGLQTSCYLNEYLQIMVALMRSMLHLLFITRLHVSFSGSALQYPKALLAALCVTVVAANFGAVSFWIVSTSREIGAHHSDCHTQQRVDYLLEASVVIAVDSLLSLILLHLFVRKLSQLIKTSATGFDSDSSRIDSQSLERVTTLIRLMTKLTVLVFVAVLTQWTNILIFIRWLPHLTNILDAIFGIICVLLCYEWHQERYLVYCFLPRQCCYHICFWWFISSDWCCQKNNDSIDRQQNEFEGGCCAVLCVFRRFARSEDEQEQELAENMSHNKHAHDQDSSNSNKGENNGDTVSKHDTNNMSKQRSFADDILADLEVSDDKGTSSEDQTSSETSDSFQHRVQTLRKLHQMLSEDEGVENNLYALRFTYRKSRALYTMRSMRTKHKSSIREHTIKEEEEINQE